jgi:hypothetical protein
LDVKNKKYENINPVCKNADGIFLCVIFYADYFTGENMFFGILFVYNLWAKKILNFTAAFD